MKNTVQKTVTASLFAALVCVATMLIKIPSPLHGYINLGDGFVLLSAWVLPLPYGIAASAIGSSLADALSGYALYVPATFVIKGLMALAAYSVCRLFSGKINGIVSRIIGAASAEATMILGYFLFEGALYGFGASVVNIPANAVQAVAGIVLGYVLFTVFEKQNILKLMK